MGRDKAKDDLLFNCSEEHEHNYVSGLYSDSEKVKTYLKKNCEDGTFKNSTHQDVYDAIENDLGLTQN